VGNLKILNKNVPKRHPPRTLPVQRIEGINGKPVQKIKSFQKRMNLWNGMKKMEEKKENKVVPKE
jgi:hypothetical protein